MHYFRHLLPLLPGSTLSAVGGLNSIACDAQGRGGDEAGSLVRAQCSQPGSRREASQEETKGSHVRPDHQLNTDFFPQQH